MAKTKYKVIAGYKIDEIAKELVKSIEAKIAKLETQATEAAEAVFIAKLPEDVVEFWKKYPDLVRTTYQFDFQIDGKKGWGYRSYVSMKIPDYKFQPTLTLADNPKLAAKLTKLVKKRKALDFEAAQTTNQIKCTLSKLRTYGEIEANFPEAYKVLIEKIDKDIPEPKPETNLCDDVEKLRAKLNKSKK